MANTLWSRTRGGSPGARMFAAYVALVLVVAIVGPGLSVYAAEGQAGEGAPGDEVPVEVAEVPVEVPVVAEEPAVVPEVVPGPEPEPEPVIDVAPVASVETPVVTVAAASVVAATPTPTPDDSNWICAGGVKLDSNPRTGTYTAGTANTIETATTPADYSITVTTYAGADGAMLMDFTSNYPVTQVKVKGSNDADFFNYSPAVYSATGLHAPVNASGKYADISHIVFCFGDGPKQVHIIATKFHDDGGATPGGVAGNGIREGGEEWLGDFVFDLYSGPDADGPWTYVATAISVGTNGQADFGMRPFGWYKIAEVLTADQIAAGWYPTTNGGVKIFETTGEYNGGLWFGNLQEQAPETGDLEVFKYLDANDNALYDDEEMLEGWDFSLYDDEDVLVGSGSTDALGKISFADLPLGDYYVTETLKDGWDNTTPLTQYVTILGDGTVQELWFGNIETELPPETGDLVIHKFEDDNENGVHDPGEAMLADWEFTVTLESDSIAARALGVTPVVLIGSGVTDRLGELSFTSLLPDTYTVTETPKPGWDNITPLVQTVDVAAGETAHVWFGNVPEEEEPETGSLIVYKYNDENRNGVHDADEPMLEDWEFTVTREVETQLEQINPSAILTVGSGLTDPDGELHFGGLLPGEYTVTETPQEGWDNITPLVQTVQVAVGQTAEVWFGNAEEFLPFTWLDLAITKVADKETAAEGGLITYTLTYWNNGNIPAENFTIVDDFDERYVSVVNANGGVVSGGKITWTLAGPLAQEAGKQTLTYTVRVSSDMPAGTTNVDNTVVISHPRDEDPSNNTAKERVVVRVSEPFLPFTGGEYMLLLGFAVAVGALGLLLRTRTDSTA